MYVQDPSPVIRFDPGMTLVFFVDGATIDGTRLHVGGAYIAVSLCLAEDEGDR